MTTVLLSIHVLAAILCVGPLAVAASLFPRLAYESATRPGDVQSGSARLLHRICHGYFVAGIAVPVFGVATGARLGVLTDGWLIASVLLTAAAAGVFLVVILPAQRDLLAAGTGETAAGPTPVPAAALRRRLVSYTGIFNLLWAVVVVLMIARPGSTTGA